VPISTPTPTPQRGALPAPGPEVAVLSADTIQISGLQSIAVTTDETADGPVKVIRLVSAGSTITGLGLRGPCAGHVRVDTAAPQDRATGGLTLDATALEATILGVPVTIAAADLPEGQLTLPGVTLPPLPADLGILTVQLFVLSIRSGAMALSSPKITTAAC
jgi:hypothetical protein